MKLYSLLLSVLYLSLGCSSNEKHATNNANQNLEGVVWELTHYTSSSGQMAAVAEETKYQFLFENQSSNVQIFIGCVNYTGGVYQLNDGYLTLNLGTADSQICINQMPEHSLQNNEIMSLLQDGKPVGSVPLMFTLSSNRLVLESTAGRSLRFVAIEELLQQE